MTLTVSISVVTSYQPLKLQTETACTGRCFYTYSLNCPLGEKIAPRDLKYYAKAASDVCPADTQGLCQDKQQCCHHYPGDCSVAFEMDKAFSVFQNCSAMQRCGWFRADSVSTRSHCSYRAMTNYVAATYSCVSGNVLWGGGEGSSGVDGSARTLSVQGHIVAIGS